MVLETIALPTELTTRTAWASLSQAFKADKRKNREARALVLELLNDLMFKLLVHSEW
jgi:hypothetical protein